MIAFDKGVYAELIEKVSVNYKASVLGIDVIFANPSVLGAADEQKLAKMFEGFGWFTIEIDGHDIEQIKKALSSSPFEKDKPTAIIAHTIKGKGVSFMENNNNWHYRTPSLEELELAKQELEKAKT